MIYSIKARLILQLKMRTSSISKSKSFPIETSSAVSSPAFTEKRKNFLKERKTTGTKTTADIHYRF